MIPTPQKKPLSMHGMKPVSVVKPAGGTGEQPPVVRGVPLSRAARQWQPFQFSNLE